MKQPKLKDLAEELHRHVGAISAIGLQPELQVVRRVNATNGLMVNSLARQMFFQRICKMPQNFPWQAWGSQFRS